MPIYKMRGKKDGKQKYRVRINFLDAAGAKRQTDRVVFGLDEAKLLEMKLTQEIKETPPDQRMTIQQLFGEYVEVQKHEVRASTLDKSRRILEYHVLPMVGEIMLDKFGLPEAKEWKQKTAVKTTSGDQALKLRTKQEIFKRFSALLNYAIKIGYISKNPLPRIGNFKDPNAECEKMDYYTADEFKLFLSAARSCAEEAEKKNDILEWHYYVFFAIAFYTGLRKGEIHALQWNDIDDGYLSVTKSITQKLKGDDVQTPPKNKSSIRTLQLPQPLINILDEHRKRCEAVDGFDAKLKICGGAQPLRDTTIQNRNKSYSKMAEVKTIRIHDFRHSHASLLANEGINIQEIARRLGHSKIEITWNTYAHLYPREEERAVSILNKIV